MNSSLTTAFHKMATSSGMSGQSDTRLDAVVAEPRRGLAQPLAAALFGEWAGAGGEGFHFGYGEGFGGGAGDRGECASGSG
jgi:hypothetical protein